ncbi:MAG TPA: IS21 family transposase [Ktedonobacteraceae bacterium]|nr:IS21 family transposase [Ktedonobacteraceae bacterium]
MSERQKGRTQKQAAARAGMSERTARKYEQAGALPSALKRPHDWQTRSNPFEEDWPWVVEQLERDPALQATTLFALLCERHPDRYRPTQDRTLRRHIARWRVLHGPEKEVMFEQVHTPGERAQSDFTHMDDLGVTIAGEPFPHLVYHFVLTYSNVEAASVCFSETFEALAEGIEKSLWQIGGVPHQHRTDHLSAAVRQLRKEEKEDWTTRYQALMAHYGMQPTWNNVSIAHENGDVEQSHHRFKQAVDQALRVRSSRDFANRAAYEHFLQNLIHKRNQTRREKCAAERAALRPLPSGELAPCKELHVAVSQFSTITVATNRYSVPSRLIGTTVLVRMRAEHLEGYVGATRVFEIPRLVGKHRSRIDYHHIIHSLVRKPGAFVAYRYHDELFPTTTFRQAYDRLVEGTVKRADREYVRILHLAATTSEAEVETALQIVLEEQKLPAFLTVRDLVQVPTMRPVPTLSSPELNLTAYDQLIPSVRCAHV